MVTKLQTLSWSSCFDSPNRQTKHQALKLKSEHSEWRVQWSLISVRSLDCSNDRNSRSHQCGRLCNANSSSQSAFVQTSNYVFPFKWISVCSIIQTASLRLAVLSKFFRLCNTISSDYCLKETAARTGILKFTRLFIVGAQFGELNYSSFLKEFHFWGASN